VWGGPECSWLKVGDWAWDQLALTGHHARLEDLDLLAELGISAVRYPVLWGRSDRPGDPTNWAWAEGRLERLAELRIRPIVGLGELTAREREVLKLIAAGLNNTEIAQQLHLSPLTAKTHVSRILTKLGARDRVQLVVMAYQGQLPID
jgi:DNA-binding CsgD family transcriptional regulator